MSIFEKFMFGIVFPLMFCLIGGLFAKKGYNHLKTKADKKVKCLSQTWGKIVDMDSTSMTTSSGRRRRAYFPTYEYAAECGVFRVKYSMGTTRRQFKIGDQVSVRYDQNSPSYSYIEGYKEDSAAAIGGLIMGSIAMLCGLFVGLFIWFN